jgi:adenylate cyclase
VSEREDPVFGPVLDVARLERTVSPQEIADRGGPPVEEVVAIIRAFGFPAEEPDRPFFTEQEAQVFIALAEAGDLWPMEIQLQASRVYGQALARIAETETYLFRSWTERTARAAATDPTEAVLEVRRALERLLPLADPMLLGVHRRWVEYELSQMAVRAAEQQAGERDVPGAVDVSFLFCDIVDFVAFAEERGDAAAVEAVSRFGDLVYEERGEHGHVVKGLGDGWMLVYPEPAEAVDAALRILRLAEERELPPIHASVNCGEAVHRDGDWFGRSVNLTARMLSWAGAGELLATKDVAERAADRQWRKLRPRRVRGRREPVTAYRLSVGPSD